MRGKILNVASATTEKLRQNAELRDLVEALGCGAGERFDAARLRYGRVIVMTDADVDGAHIASLLMTFFYREMPALIREGHLYLAQPPLYRLTGGGKSVYGDGRRRSRAAAQARLQADDDGSGAADAAAGDDAAGTKLEISRFKGLGEMPPADQGEADHDGSGAPDAAAGDDAARNARLEKRGVDLKRGWHERVDSLMGRRPELRFAFIFRSMRACSVDRARSWISSPGLCPGPANPGEPLKGQARDPSGGLH